MKLRAACFLGAVMVMLALPAAAAPGIHQTTLPLHNDASNSLVLRAWLPDEGTPVRGLLIGCHGLGGNFTNFADRATWQELAKSHSFGVVGLQYTDGDPNGDLRGGYQTVIDGLKKMATEWNHPELDTVPLCTYGFSAGGGWAAKFAYARPARTIAFVHNKGNSIGGTSAAPGIPGMLTYGSDDTTRIATIQSTFATNRGKLAPWMLLVDWARGHEEDGYTEPMAILLFDRVIERRLPAGYVPGQPYTLVGVAEADGWLGDNSSFTSASSGPDWATIASHAKYVGASGGSSWMPDEYIADLWRAVVSNNPFALASNAPAAFYDAGATIPLAGAAASGSSPSAVTYYRGNVELATATASPFSGTWPDARIAINGIFATATVGGKPRASNVVLTIVRNGMVPTIPTVAPSIIRQPSAQSVVAGGSVTFTVEATGTPIPSFQWRRNGVAVAGANSSSMTLTVVGTGDSGLYDVRATNTAGSTTSSAVMLTVNIPPVINAQPLNITGISGQTVNFSVTASGTPAPTFQWRKDGVVIFGATASTLTLSRVQSSDAGNYTVVVTNAVDSVTSNSATLVVGFAPTFNSATPLSSKTVTLGATVSFTFDFSGTAPITSQWRKNNAVINGASSPVLTLTNVQSGDAGFYTVLLTNIFGSVTSNAALLSVIPPPFISAQPANQSVVSGQAVTLTVAASSTSTPSYQWRKDGAAIPGATDATLTIGKTQPSDAGSYSVAITNAAGSVTSNAASLTIAFSRLINLSILTSLATAGDNFRMGYVVGGSGTSGTKPLVIRAAGPSLGAFGVPGTLNDPKVEFFAGSVKTGENDNWDGSAALTNAISAVGAFAYMGPTSRDAAAAVSITNRDNSLQVSAADSGTGTVLGEIYDATPAAIFTWSTPRLVNFSVLKSLGTGLTAGFVVGGSGPKNVLVRAIGPTLGSAFDVSGAVIDPQVTLLSGQIIVASNDNWGGGAILSSAFSSVGAFALSPTSRDAAVVASLNPGNYTVQVSGVGGVTGMVLVEIYELP